VRGDRFDSDPGLSRWSSESLGDARHQLFDERVGHGDDQTVGSRHVLSPARHLATSGKHVVFAPLFAAGQNGLREALPKAPKALQTRYIAGRGLEPRTSRL
jgi:hypothetical protein